MSCYNCYSKTVRNDDLVDKIIEHGEHLKNSMIQTILKDQPTIRSNENYFNKTQLEKIQMYLRGDPMHKDDELHVLNTLRSISATELSKITDQTYHTNHSSSRSSSTTNYRKIIDNNNNNLQYLKYVDCLKININSIKLNEIGNKKVFVDKLSNITQTFFIEYKLPDKLIKNTTGRIKPKINSGLDSSTNIVRLCARRSYDQEIIIFKHSSIHDIVNNLYKFDLNEIQIKFRISYRNFRQKHPEALGHAIFCFKSFKNVENINYNQDLIINSDDNQFNVGKLKFSIQLGCERLYFGREFFEIINKNLENTNDDDDDDDEEEILKINTPQLSPKKRMEKIPKVKDSSISIRIDENLQKIDDNPILFCLVCVLEAKFNREVCNSFINCQMFDHELYFSSRKSFNNLDSNPVYNFYQEVPLIYNDALLTKLRDNFMILEFLEQTRNQQKHFLIGLAKLSLHSFYLNFRNSIIVKYLKNNHLPVISTDGWETISNPFNDHIIGEASILVALGTKEQIDNLLNERGLKNTNNVVIVKNKLRNQSVQVDGILENSNLLTKSSKQTNSVGVQSDMEHKDIGSLLNQLINVQKQQQQRNRHVENSTNTDIVAVVDYPPPQSQQQQQPEIRRTSDLLETLNKALSLSDNKNNEKKTFKCEILIDSALHLPSRKKCKSKKSKNNKNNNNNNNNKHDDILLPSTYVTFETTPNNLKMTPIITKCTNPKWAYRCDVLLPIEYLTNNQKRLIFKVWRKSTNTTLTPNLQTDFIIGFATVDLTILLAGSPNIQEWYNIVDFSNKSHGQINIHIRPLENISRFQQHKQPQQQESLNNDNKIEATTTTVQIEHDDDDDDDCSELLSRTLKRKFTELDEITQRLRLRLSKITNDNDEAEDDILSNNDDIVDDNDELIDEFEHDINTLCVEDDFDTIDFDKIARNFNENHIKEIGLLKQTLHSNDDDDDDNEKQKIDNLVGNLSINDASTRHISGCSSNTNNSFDTGTILNQLEQNSRPNIHTTESFNRTMLEKYNWPSTSSSCSESSDVKQ